MAAVDVLVWGVHTGVLRDGGHRDCPALSSDSEEEEVQCVQIYVGKKERAAVRRGQRRK